MSSSIPLLLHPSPVGVTGVPIAEPFVPCKSFGARRIYLIPLRSIRLAPISGTSADMTQPTHAHHFISAADPASSCCTAQVAMSMISSNWLRNWRQDHRSSVFEVPSPSTADLRFSIGFLIGPSTKPTSPPAPQSWPISYRPPSRRRQTSTTDPMRRRSEGNWTCPRSEPRSVSLSPISFMVAVREPHCPGWW